MVVAAGDDAASQEGIFLNGCAAIGTGQASISRTPDGLTEQILFLYRAYPAGSLW